MDPVDLERLIDGELKRLPAPQAPPSLLPRVLAAAAASAETPWYARPWFTWPRAWQVASAVLLVALGVGLAMLLTASPRTAVVMQHGDVGSGFSRISTPAAATVETKHEDVGSGFSRISSAVARTAALARLVWDIVLGPAVFWLLAVAISLSLACALVWSALERAAVGETK